jgi:hypothetical protein
MEASSGDDQVPKQEGGTYCGVVGEQLAIRTCPLPKGSCMWKHRLHGSCMFTQEPITSHDFARRVGLPVLPVDVVNIVRRSLKHKLKEELAT